jgi:hypothetical protein
MLGRSYQYLAGEKILAILHGQTNTGPSCKALDFWVTVTIAKVLPGLC